MATVLEAATRPVVVTATGPMTNVAELLRMYCPGRLVNRVMGGLLPMAVWGRW